MVIPVFVNYNPHPTFKLRQELGGRLATSYNIRNPAAINNASILENIQGETLQLEDGFFHLNKFKHLGNWDYSVEISEILSIST
jgi:hypothetical protein